MKNVAVIAIGGNSLIKDKNHQSVADQYQAIAQTCAHIADVIMAGYEVVITHGNGPQVGFVLLRSELASGILHTVPLDSCDADTQGALGYQIQQALDNEFSKRGIHKPVVSLVTQVVVAADDPSFTRPTKPIGPFYTAEEAEKRRASGWEMIEDSGRGYRRVVASPKPLEILEEKAIVTLIDNGFVVVAVGGGGIPVIRDQNGLLSGAAAVIDKDLASSLLASDINADLLVISTGVHQVALNYKTPQQKRLAKITVAQAREYMAQGHFQPGSMLPKIEAAIAYLQKGGKRVIITNPKLMLAAICGDNGTHIVPD